MVVLGRLCQDLPCLLCDEVLTSRVPGSGSMFWKGDLLLWIRRGRPLPRQLPPLR